MNQHTQRNELNFEFWTNGELSKIGHHFSNRIRVSVQGHDLKIDFIKKCQ